MTRAIITFHAVDDAPSPLSYPPALLPGLLDGLDRARLPVVALDTLLASDAPGVALTFDDGMASVFHAALPLLRERRLPAHLFLTTGSIGANNRWHGQPAAAQSYAMLDWPQVEALHASGIAIEGHSDAHPDLRTLSSAAITGELERADALIERRLGRRPRFFAYPYGYHDAAVRAVAAVRYAGAVTTDLGFVDARCLRECLPRLDSHYLRDPRLVAHLGSVVSRAYLALRRRVRIVRGNN